jgi:hypothetical protein
VENCTVLYDQILREAPSSSTQQIDKDGSEIAQTGSSTADLVKEEFWYPVQCEACSLEIAVMDQDEVYHFFNVFAS